MTDGYATSGQIRKELSKKFEQEQISKLPATQKRPAIDYVNHAIVTDRLNNVVPGWTMSQPELMTGKGSEGGVFVLCSMTIDGITRWEVGEGDDYKKALSDWIKRAAMRFGVALDLWAKAELESASVQRELESLDGPAAGEVEGPKLAVANGEGASSVEASTSQSLASPDQWSLLIAASMTEKLAVNKLNKANKSSYANIEQARRLATQEQLDKALAEV